MSAKQQRLNERIQQEARFLHQVTEETAKIIVGQDKLVNRLLIALLCNNHVLIEGLPGLAKTLTIRTLAATISANFQRIQFTPDLLPADLIGTQIYNPQTGEFTPRTGPIFSNIILADEINRAPAKVQSALLESMEERQVTIGEKTFHLDDPFMVLATQNPIEQEGTYPLPEAQLDRFMLKVIVEYPSRPEERQIIERMLGQKPESVTAVINQEQLKRVRKALEYIYLDDRIKDYVLDIVFLSREPGDNLRNLISVGVSPRATLFLLKAAQAHAFLQGRGFVMPEDIKQIAPDVLRHRIILTFEAEADNIGADEIIAQMLHSVQVP